MGLRNVIPFVVHKILLNFVIMHFADNLKVARMILPTFDSLSENPNAFV